MDYQNIRYEVSRGVARLTLSRPDKLNSFTVAMHAEIRDALDSLEADNRVRVLVIGGAGRAFCAGQDLADREMVVGATAPDIGNVVERYYKPLILRLQNLRVPTVAMVHGVAAGAGVSLALACDLVIAGESASFLQAFNSATAKFARTHGGDGARGGGWCRRQLGPCLRPCHRRRVCIFFTSL